MLETSYGTMTPNRLQFQEDGLEIWITIPPKVQCNKTGATCEPATSESKVVSLANLYSPASYRQQHTETDLASSKVPFVWKLYQMLQDVDDSMQHRHIVSWVRYGKAFKVHHMKLFVDAIIPKYFTMSKYKSFQRQLYFYGFRRVQDGPDTGAYYHDKFIRGRKSLCLSMTPKNNSRRRKRGSACSTAIKTNIPMVVRDDVLECTSSSCSVSTKWDDENDSYLGPSPLTRNSESSRDIERRDFTLAPEDISLERQQTDIWIAYEPQDLLLDDQGNKKQLHGHGIPEQQHREECASRDAIDYVFGGMAFHAV